MCVQNDLNLEITTEQTLIAICDKLCIQKKCPFLHQFRVFIYLLATVYLVQIIRSQDSHIRSKITKTRNTVLYYTVAALAPTQK